MADIDFDELKKSLHGLQKLSLRGASLNLAAYVEEVTRSLLRQYFVNQRKLAQKLLEDTGALSTFSARIDTAYALGLIADSERRNLHLVRQIRNEFAHNFNFDLSFETPEIRGLCLALEVPESTTLLPGISSTNLQGRFAIAASLFKSLDDGSNLSWAAGTAPRRA